MAKLIGGAFLSCMPALIQEREKDHIQNVIEYMENVSTMICQYKPQTIVIVTKQSLFPSSFTIDVQPRIKGDMGKYGLMDTTLGFETDSLLMRSIITQSKRVGIELEELSQQAEDNHLSKDMDYQSFIPLYYLYKAGFKGQVVSIGSNQLAYEEMYTFGKSLQMAIQKVNKRVMVITVGQFSKLGQADDTNMVREIGIAIENTDIKALLNIDKSVIPSEDEEDFSKLFLILGVVGGQEVTPQIFTQGFIEEKQCIFLLHNKD